MARWDISVIRLGPGGTNDGYINCLLNMTSFSTYVILAPQYRHVNTSVLNRVASESRAATMS